MEIAVVITLTILIVLVILLLLRKPVDQTTLFDARIREQFLTFQTELHKELNTTRDEVVRSKDILSQHTITTIETIKNMGQTIHKIITQQEDAQRLGQSLKDLLQAPKLRGNYGETILEEMLDRILPKGIWERQYLIDGREKVDAVVRYRDVVVPIDAKFPRDDYLRYLDAPTTEEKSRYWKQYETAVRLQIRSIGSKYVKPEKGTTEFALMFIPSEAIYYETIAEKNYLGEPSALYQYAQDNHVVPVSPNTFYAFLQIIMHGVRNLELIKTARKLQENLSQIQRSFEAFYKKYEEIGKQIEKANEAFRIGDGHVQRFKQRLEDTISLDGFSDETTTASEQ